MKTEFTTRKSIRKRTIFSFSVFFIVGGLLVWGWTMLKKHPGQDMIGGVPKPIRKVLDKNESVFRVAFDSSHLAKTYPKSMAAKKPRVNGMIGLRSAFDSSLWKLEVIRAKGDTLRISLEEIKKLPKTEIIFDFKCVEGWDQVTHWGGVKFSDFIKAYGLDSLSQKQYVGLSTPDGEYYVGIDMPSAMHPQTLLCYEMNGEPLSMKQGYPLRIILTVKYGVKSLKRIGTMYFDNERPKDYWHERGYDYYLGL